MLASLKKSVWLTHLSLKMPFEYSSSNGDIRLVLTGGQGSGVLLLHLGRNRIGKGIFVAHVTKCVQKKVLQKKIYISAVNIVVNGNDDLYTLVKIASVSQERQIKVFTIKARS